MNKDQIVSLVMSIMKIAAGAAMAHGATKAAAFLNAEDVTGAVCGITVLLYSHFYNAPNRVGVALQKTDKPAAPLTPGSTP